MTSFIVDLRYAKKVKAKSSRSPNDAFVVPAKWGFFALSQTI